MENSKTVWHCPNCNEQVEEHFEVCWNCQHDRSGNVPRAFPSLEEEDRAERASLTEKWRDKNCVQCKTVLTYAGKKEFHEGMAWGALGDLAELLVDHTKLEMYVCPSCRRVEFFV